MPRCEGRPGVHTGDRGDRSSIGSLILPGTKQGKKHGAWMGRLSCHDVVPGIPIALGRSRNITNLIGGDVTNAAGTGRRGTNSPFASRGRPSRPRAVPTEGRSAATTATAGGGRRE